MGKTSILRFVEKRVPDYVLAVYVNLEKGWSDQEAPNLWGFLMDRVVDSIGWQERYGDTPLSRPHQAKDLVALVGDACRELGKRYVLLLLDEFRMIVERSREPSAVLAEFRDFHDNPKNRISLMVADRSTRRELEARCPHDIWAQLTSKRIGPLDREAIAQALSTPTIGSDESDVEFLPETVDRLYKVTGGYPYHVVRATQAIVDTMWHGPWLVALPEDVDTTTAQMVSQDDLFQIGLCRPDRIDSQLEDGIAALLEWGDLIRLVTELQDDEEWRETLKSWNPAPKDFLAGLGNPDAILERLRAVGVLKEGEEPVAFFSPLVESWIRRMRDEGRPLGAATQNRRDWGITSFGDGSTLSAEEWQALDARLIEKCRSARVGPPLKERATSPDDWRKLTEIVTTENGFRGFLDVAFKLFIDAREDKALMRGYPRLSLAYHLLRLVRNYHVHSANMRSRSTIDAWDEICSRALRRRCRSYQPMQADEWSAIRSALLRSIHAGLCNAIALVGVAVRS